MNPVEKAVWFVETQFERPISLEEIARVAGVSRYHMARAFAEATGQSVMRYARGRRLTEAARSLAAGAPDILAVALSAGYGSHEAFSRAFRDQFDLTPETIRRHGVFDAAAVQRLQEEHLSGRRKNNKILFSLLMFHLWSERRQRTTATALERKLAG